MKICPRCHAQNEDYSRICYRCGAQLNMDPGQRGGAGNRGYGDDPGQRGGAGNRGYGDDRGRGYDGHGRNVAYPSSPFDHTREFSPDEISKGKPLAMFVYLFGAIGVLFGLINQKNHYVQFHVRQCLKYEILQWLINAVCLTISGLIMLITVMVAGSSLRNNFGNFSPDSILSGFGASGVFLTIAAVCVFVILILRLICFFGVCSGRAVEAPLVRYFSFMK